jgi:hypothetical protein
LRQALAPSPCPFARRLSERQNADKVKPERSFPQKHRAA